MDPLSAFSLTCNIIQVVDFSSKAWSICKELYDRGTFSEYQDLEETTKHLIDLQGSLALSGRNAPSSPGSAQVLSQQDALLMKVAKQCSETAEQLVKKLQKFSVTGPHHKKRRALTKTFKALWKGSDIQRLQRQLKAHQKALDTRILIDLRRRQDLTSLQQRQDFQEIDQKVQTLISSLAQGPKLFKELRALIRDEHEKTQKLIKEEHVQTREHVTKSFLELDHAQEGKQFRTQLLESLWFNELYIREETIRDAYPQTFKWILDKSARNIGPWDNFVEWLEFGQGTYWISGKPGSGKSTLMSFICHNDRTIESLRIWSANKDILILKFYFWSGGTPMEKNIIGLLRSLLWQVLKRVPSLRISSLQVRNGISLITEPIPSWTERSLRTIFGNIIRQISETHRICIFLDGLDEFDVDQDELVSWIRETLESSEIKMCLSSRLYRAFDDAFGSSTKLRLQDLTRDDIRAFVVNEFQDQEVLQILSKAAEASNWLEWTEGRILDRAEGVFLWVDLAVKDQIRGLKNGDSLQQLKERLEKLPGKIEDVYARMLRQIEELYKNEASIFVQIALRCRGGIFRGRVDRSLLGHVLAMQPDLDNMLSSPDSMLEEKVITSYQTVEKRIATICAGLLEVIHKDARESRELHTHMDDRESYYSSNRGEPYTGSHLEESGSGFDGGEIARESNGEDADSADKHLYALSKIKILVGEGKSAGSEVFNVCYGTQVVFVHRTAVDFMTHREQGGAFLNNNTPINFDVQVFYVKTLLARVRLLAVLELDEHEMHRSRLIEIIMSSISEIEYRTGVAQTNLCSLTDDIMSRFDRDHNGHEDSHWSARWGPKEFRQQKDDVISSISSEGSKMRFKGSVSSIDLQSEDDDDLSMVLRREPSFLSLAASYGLFLYVRQVLEGRRTPLEVSSANWLLYSSMLSIPWNPNQYDKHFCGNAVAALQLMKDMLRRGANPNCVISGVDTIWSSFLKRTHDVFYHESFVNTDVSASTQFRPEVAQTTVAFCENGADLNRDCVHKFFFEISTKVEDQYEYFDNEFYVDMSPLAFAELYLSSQKEISRIREICFSSGVSYYARCFKFVINNDRGELKGEYDVSEAESDTVMEILRGDYFTSLGRERIEEGLEEVGDKILRERLPSQTPSQRSSTESSRSLLAITFPREHDSEPDAACRMEEEEEDYDWDSSSNPHM